MFLIFFLIAFGSHAVLCKNNQNYEVCTSQICKDVGEELANQLSHDEEACQDFYQFVCKKWYDKNKTPKHHSWWDQLMKMQRKAEEKLNGIIMEDATNDVPVMKLAKRYHRACMKKADDGIQPIKKILDAHGGWPIVKQRNIPTEYPFWHDVYKKYMALTSDPIFYKYNATKTGNRLYPTIHKPDLLISHLTLVDKANWAIKEDYWRMIHDIIYQFVEYEATGPERAQIAEDIDNIFLFEIEWAKMIYKQDLRASPEYFGMRYKPIDDIKPVSFSRFQRLYEEKLHKMKHWRNTNSSAWLQDNEKCIYKIDFWEDVITFFHPDPFDSLDLFGMKAGNEKYYADLCKLLENTDDRTLLNYVHWHLVKTLLPYTNSTANDIFMKAAADLNLNVHAQSYEDKFHKCLEENVLKDIFYYEYVKRHSPSSIDYVAYDVVNAMDLETALLFNKAPNTPEITPEMHYVLKYKASDYVKNFEEMSISVDNESASSYAEQVLINKKYKNKILFKDFIKDVEENERWPTTPWTSRISAEYKKYNNSIMIPAMILQSPVYDVDLPKSYLYGSLGVAYAQKTSEVLNRYYAISFANKSKELFETTVDCYKKQSVTGALISDTEDEVFTEYKLLNGTEQPAGEKFKWSHKIQDAVGLEIARSAYERRTKIRGKENIRLPGLEKYNDEQLLFIAFANTHCEAPKSGNLRNPLLPSIADGRYYSNHDMVNLAIKNNPRFPQVFGCPKGTPMNSYVARCDFMAATPQDSV